jgi:hypothetical protein
VRLSQKSQTNKPKIFKNKWLFFFSN